LRKIARGKIPGAGKFRGEKRLIAGISQKEVFRLTEINDIFPTLCTQ
jgi:hypothetical protein